MENLREYFARTDTPSSNSPVAALMWLILKKNPGMDFEQARALANAKKGIRYTPQILETAPAPDSWTEAEETLFAEIASVSRLNRIEAIRLYRRSNSNPERTLTLAIQNYPPINQKLFANIAKAQKGIADKRASRKE
jgi:hypothetical protein